MSKASSRACSTSLRANVPHALQRGGAGAANSVRLVHLPKLPCHEAYAEESAPPRAGRSRSAEARRSSARLVGRGGGRCRRRGGRLGLAAWPPGAGAAPGSGCCCRGARRRQLRCGRRRCGRGAAPATSCSPHPIGVRPPADVGSKVAPTWSPSSLRLLRSSARCSRSSK